MTEARAHLFKLPCSTSQYRRVFFFQIIILFIHLLTLMNVILYFICMGLVDLRGARGNWKAKNTKWKILGTRSYNLAIHRQTLLLTGLIGLILHIYCYLSYIDTFHYVTQCSTCTRQNTLYFTMPRIYTNVYFVIGSHVSLRSFLRRVFIKRG